MPIERRQIMLSEPELLQAIQSYRRMHPDFLPHGELKELGLKPSADGGVQLTIDVSMIYGQMRQIIRIEPVAKDIVERLVRCCLENNIPIPRAGRKSAGIVDGMLALIICTDDEIGVPRLARRA
jgi:hypothetical protein